jgi:hypothetical protein
LTFDIFGLKSAWIWEKFIRSNWGGFPETVINLENTADLAGKSRENVENRGKTEKTLIKTVSFFNRTLLLGYIRKSEK